MFTRREYAASPRSGAKKGSAGSASLEGGQRGFQRIVVGNNDTLFAVDDDPLINTEDHTNSSSVSGSARQSEWMEITALDHAHLR